MDHTQALKALAERSTDAALDPNANPNTLPQLIGAATKAQIAAAKIQDAQPPPEPEWQPDHPNGHPELDDLMPLLPGPPWDPWRGHTPQQLEHMNDILIARAIIFHYDRAEKLTLSLAPHADERIIEARDELAHQRELEADQEARQ